VACIRGIQIIRENSPGGFSVRVTLYGKANKKTADRLRATREAMAFSPDQMIKKTPPA
jgi:hypothetical protein